jgi:bifunctional non-homologous end joining protein LigD
LREKLRTVPKGRDDRGGVEAAAEGFPTLIHPMLAAIGDLPANEDGWGFEFKWDGIRGIFYCGEGGFRILSRNDRDVTVTYPELEGLAEAVGAATAGTSGAVLDGEIVALGPHGRPSFGALQHRMGVMQASRAAALASEQPVVAMLFDVLYVEGASTVKEPYTERRRLLESLGLSGSHWQTPPSFEGRGETLLEAAKEQHLEGVMAKRLKSPYIPGRRSEYWRKVKVERTQSVVVGGFTPGQGRRGGGIGALLLGVYDPDGGLVYIGKVGTGFSDAVLSNLESRIIRIRRSTSPFSGQVPARESAGATWCRPSLVGEVRYGEWTTDRRLRHPVWLGLRPDLDPESVVAEPVTADPIDHPPIDHEN